LSVPPASTFFLFFHPTASSEIYTLSLHDALPISKVLFGADICKYSNLLASYVSAINFCQHPWRTGALVGFIFGGLLGRWRLATRSEEHTSELQSRFDLVCRLLLEKKKQNTNSTRQ